MTTTLTIFDETLRGERAAGPILNFPTTRITLRELIRARVYEEVRAHNCRVQEHKESKVQPTAAECALNAETLVERKPTAFHSLKPLDWEEQAERALQAFQCNRFFVLIGERQIESLDDPIELRVGADIVFLRLIPLAGG